MKNVLFILLFSLVLYGCASEEATPKETDANEPDIEKYEKMLDSGVKLYLHQMTKNYSNAFTISTTKEDKMKYLNEAITDINIAVQEIKDEYEEGAPPTNELFQLADALLDTIEYEMIGESEQAVNSANDAGVIIGNLSREYLDGELPIGIQIMIGKENAFD